MLTYPWKCTVLHCNHLGNAWKPLVLMTRHFDYCLSASEGDNQSVRSSAPVVSMCFPGGYNVKLYISRGRLAWWLLAFLHSDIFRNSQWQNSHHTVDLYTYRNQKPMFLHLYLQNCFVSFVINAENVTSDFWWATENSKHCLIPSPCICVMQKSVWSKYKCMPSGGCWSQHVVSTNTM